MTENSLHDMEEPLEIARYTPKELLDYEDSLKVYRDLKNVIDTAEMKGQRKGIEIGQKQGIEIGQKQGIEIGELKATKRIASTMKAQGFPLESISKALGLSIEDIEKL